MAENFRETVSDAAMVNSCPPSAINSDSELLASVSLILDELDHEDYISLFFLMMDFIEPIEYLKIVKCTKSVLKKRFQGLWQAKKFNEAMMVELMGTMKKYKLLKQLGTCHHMFNQRVDSFTQINDIWKCLYLLCEDMSEYKLQILKVEFFGNNLTNFTFESAEELFCHAFVNKIFSKDDLTALVAAFKKLKPEYLRIISLLSEKTNALKEYPMKTSSRTSHCGIALIINHVNFYRGNGIGCGDSLPMLNDRKNTEIDVENLKEMWERYGFKTEIVENLTDDEVHKKFRELSELDHSAFDAFVACYLSHGDIDRVYASNSKPILIKSLTTIMANQCPTLFNKPKLFFIQACQGTQIQQGVIYPDIKGEETGLQTDCKMELNPPKLSDVYTVISSVPGYVSFRDNKGSWFVTALVKWMNLFGDKEDIKNIILRVTNEVASQTGRLAQYDNCKQIPLSESTLRHCLIFKKRQV